MNKMYISVYLRNHEDGPSCYYRIMQYFNKIDEYSFKINDALSLQQFRKNMDIRCKGVKKLYQIYLFFVIFYNRFTQINYDLKHKPNIVVIQREVFPRFFPPFLKYFFIRLCEGRKVIWDFDDSILECGEISKTEWKILSIKSDYVIATSDYLLNKVNNKFGDKICMPTTDGYCDSIDMGRIIDTRRQEYDKTVRMVWVGTHSNLQNVVEIIDQIQEAGKELTKIGKKLELVIVCNVEPVISKEKYDCIHIRYRKWTRKAAEDEIFISHIGLMPIPDTEFSKGKGGFKLVQYIASGLPVLGSDVGYNREIIKEGNGALIKDKEEWISRITQFSTDIIEWEKMCKNSLRIYDKYYSYNSNLINWEKILKECMKND